MWSPVLSIHICIVNQKWQPGKNFNLEGFLSSSQKKAYRGRNYSVQRLGQQSVCAARKAFDSSNGIVITCNQAFTFSHFFLGEHPILGEGGNMKFEDRQKRKGRRTTWFKVFMKNSSSRKKVKISCIAILRVAVNPDQY